LATSGYKRIDIKVDEHGKVHVDTSGFSGKACTEEAEKLIAMLKQAGLDVNTEDVKLKEEFYVAAKGDVRTKAK